MSKLINHITIKNYIEYLLLTLILVTSFFLRLYKIDNPIADWHSWRQADTISVSKVYVQNGVDLLFPRYHDISTIQTGIFNPEGYRFVEFPLFNALHAYTVKYIGYFSLEVWGRLLVIISTLISAYILFLIGRKYTSSIGGLLAAALFGFIPYNIYYSRAILPEPFAVMLALLSLYSFINYIEKDRFSYLFSSAVFLSTSFLIKPFTFFYAFPMIYLLINKFGVSKLVFKKDLLIFAIVVVTPLIAWRFWINDYPEGIPFYKWAFNGDGIRFKPAFFRWIFAERFGKLILGVWGIIPLTYGLINQTSRSRFISIFALSTIVYVSLIAEANVRHDYYQIVTVPAITLLLSFGLVSMWKAVGLSKITTRATVVFSLMMIFIIGGQQIKEYYNINRPEIIEAGTYVNENTEANALIIAPYNGDTAFLYQTGRWGWPYKDREITEMIANGADYFVSVNFDVETNSIEKEYKTIFKNNNFVLIDLKSKTGI